MNAKSIASLVRSAFEEKKGLDPLILDVRKLTDIADFFVLVHGSSDRHVRTLADHVLDCLSEKGIEPAHVEGLSGSKWILLDYTSVIVHVFYHETRKFYNLERLWGDGQIVTPKRQNERRVKKTHRSRPA